MIMPAVEGVDLVGWARDNRAYVERALIENGGLLFRGFGVTSAARFEEFARSFADPLLNYTYRSTPRSNVSANVFTSTEYPEDQRIPLHNEMSYTSNWPLKIWFCCLKAAEREERPRSPTAGRSTPASTARSATDSPGSA